MAAALKAKKRREKERLFMAALMCIQRCIRQRRAELNYRAMLKEKYRKEAWDAAEAAKEFLLELEIARQLLERQRVAHLEDLVIKFKKRGRALAFVRFHHNRDEARWLEGAGSYSNHA